MDKGLRQLYFAELEREIKELVDPVTGLLCEKYSRVIKCPLCGSEIDEHRKLFVKNGYTFVRCDKCGMIFTNPQVNQELLSELYGRSKSNDLWVEIQKSEKEKSWKRKYYLDMLKLLNEYINKEMDIRLMDIGCSTGYFLELLREYYPNWKGKGVEINDIAYEYVISKKIDVERKFLAEIDASEKYNIFTMFGVLEHLPKPKEILKDIRLHSMGKDTIVLAVVPNAYSLYHMFIQEKSLSFDGRNHLLYFSDKTLKKLFEDNGYEVIHLDTVLTGKDNIKRQMQWLDPYENIDTDDFMPGSFKGIFENGRIEELIYNHGLGLRLRVVAKVKNSQT